MGLVHRDIKPSNIMVDPATGRAKLGDFGLARLSSEVSDLTRDGEVAGTPAYLSPEQANGDPEAGSAADIYALGATLYECLAGEPPFRGAHQRVIQQILNDEPRPPRALNDAVPRDLETVCLKAMAKEPHARYASAGDLAADLRRWLCGEPVKARPASPLERLWRLARRRPLAASLVATLAAVVLLGSVAVVALWRRAESSAAVARAIWPTRRGASVRRDAVDTFYRRFYVDGLLKKPGLEAYRAEVLRDMLAYYRAFVERGGGDPALRSDLAEASFRVGLITMDLGDKRDALAALEHTRDLYEAVLRDRSADQDVRRRLAVCYDKIGAALGALGRTPEALLAHARECDLNRQIVASAPEDLGTRRFLGTSLGMLANAYSMHGDGPHSQQYYREAGDQFRELLRRDPTNRVVMVDLAMTLNNMSLGQPPSGVQMRSRPRHWLCTRPSWPPRRAR